MTKYNITLDDKVIETADSYKEACEIAEELDKHPANYWKIVDIVKCKSYEEACDNPSSIVLKKK